MLENFIGSIFRAWLWEFCAALAGLIYLLNVRETGRWTRRFVYFLWITFFIDLSGAYVRLAYYSDYTIFGFIENTVWQRNYWLYNSYNIFVFLFFSLFFISQLSGSKIKKVLRGVCVFYLLSAWINLIVSGKFFTGYSAYTFLLGTLLLSVSIGFYFYQLLKSDKILSFYKDISFYIASGTLLNYLAFTPMFLYNNFAVMKTSPEFVDIYLTVLALLNFVMYGFYTLGFIIEIRKKREKQYI
ncbi:hypothetical protein [Salegentibacter chungangensis]|uniref:Uncharacterized protein n=1 Tax=Salegentibacter chungangensis TaxID=1335724 RepID=A0ABW3NRE0_9FLAO